MRQAQEPRFKYVGGAPCLDFTNTVGAWVPTGARDAAAGWRFERDKLHDYSDLVLWAEGAGLLAPATAQRACRRAAQRPRHAAQIFRRATNLRDTIYRLVAATLDGRTPPTADLAQLDREAAAARAHQRLVAHAARLTWEWADTSDLDAVLWPIALAAVRLLTADDMAQVRRCGGDDCGWLFLDTTRNRRRHWCDMRDCGNLAKVRRFRARQHRAPAARRRPRPITQPTKGVGHA